MGVIICKYLYMYFICRKTQKVVIRMTAMLRKNQATPQMRYKCNVIRVLQYCLLCALSQPWLLLNAGLCFAYDNYNCVYKSAVREEPTRMQWTWISVFILQALADNSTDETPNQQKDKVERNVSRKQKRLVMTDM